MWYRDGRRDALGQPKRRGTSSIPIDEALFQRKTAKFQKETRADRKAPVARSRFAFSFRRLAVPPLEAPAARFLLFSLPGHTEKEGANAMPFFSTAKQLVSITERRCATCRWWPGEREITFLSQRPFKVQSTGNARCQAKGISVSGGQSHCSKWTKWERLP